MRRLALIGLIAAVGGWLLAFTDVAAAPRSRTMLGGGVSVRVQNGWRSAAQPVRMTATPRGMLASCRRNPLLRPLCPRRMPGWGSSRNGSQGYYCMTAHPRGETMRQTLILFGTRRCVFAEWSYENGESLGTFTVGRQLSGWDGRGWVSSEWTLLPPPFHVGIDIQASQGSRRNLTLGLGRWPRGAHRVSDFLFDPARSQAVSLGWVRWFGRSGQLILTPRGACESGDALILYLPPNAQRISYEITLDAWMPAARLTGKRFDRRYRFESGAALPRAIATLKAIIASGLGR